MVCLYVQIEPKHSTIFNLNTAINKSILLFDLRKMCEGIISFEILEPNCTHVDQIDPDSHHQMVLAYSVS